MSPRAATIQIFLPAGDPRGIRVAEMTTRIVQVIEVPRSLLADFLAMPESGQVALYFLFGESEDGTDPRVYIGQTGDLRARLTSHNKEKDFWERAVVLISRTNNLTQTHALYLEWYCLQVATDAARYQTENGTRGSRPHTPAPLEADCQEIFHTSHALLSTLGYPLFDTLARRRETSNGTTGSEETNDGTAERFFIRKPGTDAQGLYTPDGMVVLAGSFGPSRETPSFALLSAANARRRLIDSGVVVRQDEKFVFIKDHLFKSPSGASDVVLGSGSNGWVAWTSKDGRTLDSLKRQAL